MSLNKSVLKTSSYRNFNLCLDCFKAEAGRSKIAGIDRIGRYGEILRSVVAFSRNRKKAGGGHLLKCAVIN